MPVGLWQQPCSSTTSPAGIFSIAASASSNARLFVLASKYGKLFVGTPAAAKICGWLGQVGCVSQTVALGIC